MKVKVLSNINSGQFVAGDVVDLADSEAQELIAAGAVKQFDENEEQDQPAADENQDQDQVTPPADEVPAADQPPADQGGVPTDAPLDQPPAEQLTPPAEQLPADGQPPADDLPTDAPTPEQIAQDIANTEGQPDAPAA